MNKASRISKPTGAAGCVQACTPCNVADAHSSLALETASINMQDPEGTFPVLYLSTDSTNSPSPLSPTCSASRKVWKFPRDLSTSTTLLPAGTRMAVVPLSGVWICRAARRKHTAEQGEHKTSQHFCMAHFFMARVPHRLFVGCQLCAKWPTKQFKIQTAPV